MEYYEVAAKWWLDTIKSSVTETEISEKIYKAFNDELKKTIRNDVETNGSCFLNSNHGPTGTLAKVAVLVNLITKGFPSNTYMHIEINRVRVQKGNNKSFVEIFSC